jgi:hypothetical protein
MNLTPPGVVPSICNAALSIGGNLLRTEDDIERMNTDISDMRNAVKLNPYDQFIMLICKAFPKYTPSEVETLEYQEMLRLLVMAEQLVGLEEPVQLKKNKQENLTDQLFKDARRGEQVDRGMPNKMDPTYNKELMLRQAAGNKDLSMQQARQLEMIRRIKERSAA